MTTVRDASRGGTGSGGESARSRPGAAPDEAAALARFVTRQLEVLDSTVPRVLSGQDPDAVHDLRVATRRLQEAISVLTSASPAKRARRLRRTLRRARRALGAWRNLDVSIEESARRRRATRSPRRREVWKLVADYLEERRVDETIHARKRLLHTKLRSLPKDAGAIVDRLVRGMPPASVGHSVRSRIGESWAEWRQAFAAASVNPTVPAVHALRIATKRLRYRVEVARELDPPGAEPVLRWARQAQQRLGDWHDGQVLHQLVAEALARPEILLDRLDTARAALAELERERRSSPPLAPSTIVSAEEGAAAVESCLERLEARP